MRFEWDPEKARTNLIKHHVDFESSRFVFDDPLAILVPDRIIDGEERWHIIGRTPDHRLTLSFTPFERTAMTQRSASSQPEKQTLVSIEHTSWESDPYIGSEAHQRELAAFDALTDDEIDYSDIPEQDPKNWQGARRGNHFFTQRARDAVLVDTEVIAWFRQRYPEYQKAMNAALRAYMASHDEERDDLDPRKTA